MTVSWGETTTHCHFSRFRVVNQLLTSFVTNFLTPSLSRFSPIGDKRNPEVTSSDGHVGRLVGKRQRETVVFYGI